jgi:hypothetical protein
MCSSALSAALTNNDDAIPIAQVYRGIPVHNEQSVERIRNIVQPEIDLVFGMDDVDVLFAFAADIRHCPEASLFSAAKLTATWELAAEGRRVRPGIDLERVRAVVVGLNSRHWRSPTHYCSSLDVPAAPGQPGAVKRDIELPD